MDGGSWKILEKLPLNTATEPLTLAVGLNVLKRPHGGHKMFLPVDQKDLRALL